MTNKEDRNRVEQIIIKDNVNTSDMYNKERKIAFINGDDFLNSTDPEIITALQRFNQYGILETEFNKDILYFDKSNYLDFFKSFSWGYSSFNTNKSIIKKYVYWGRDQKYIDSKIANILDDVNYSEISHKKMFETYYFKTLSELKQSIENFKSKTIIAEKSINFRIAEISLYLSWFGVKIQDACEIQQIDINEQNQTIFIKSKNQTIKIDSQDKDAIDAFQKIIAYKNSSDYIKSDMLIRTERQNKITVGRLSNILSGYFGDNELNNNNNDKIITYNKVYLSGIYSRVFSEFRYQHLDEIDLSVEKLSEIFQSDYAKLKNPQPTISKQLIEYADYMGNEYGSEYFKG